MKKSIVFILIIALVAAVCSLALQSCGEADDDKKDGGGGAEEAGGAPEETPSETEPPTPAPTTPIATTTEKPPIVLEEVLRWTFSEDDKVFKTGNQVSNLRVEDGILKLTSIGGDPFMYTINVNLGLDASEVNFIKIKALNHSENDRTQLFFITDEDGGWSEAMSMKSTYWYTEGEQWEIIEFDTYDSDRWEGTIKQIRLDPLEAEGDVEIEYVSFEKIVK